MAASLVENGETVFLGAGPLMLETALALSDRSSLTVITNGLEVACHIAEHTFILTGGQLEREEKGLLAVDILQVYATLSI